MPIWALVLIGILAVAIISGFLPERRHQWAHYTLQSLALVGLGYEIVVIVVGLFTALGWAGFSGLTAFATMSCMCFFL